MKNKLYMKKMFIIINILIYSIIFGWSQNYSKQMQQAILLYQEGKNTDAMDRFMDILVTGTPEEKILASEYISKITQGISPQTQKNSDTKVITVNSKDEKNREFKNATTQPSSSKEINEEDVLSKKVQDKIKEIKNDILVSIYRKNFIKLYMDSNNERPNYILLKEDKIFNEDMTFKTNVIEDLKLLSGLLTVLNKLTITILPNGAISGNMKIANVRRATILHSYFLSSGLSPTKVKLDIIGNIWQNIIAKKIDDFDGIILVMDYNKEPELVSDSELPQTYIALYPEKIDITKNQATIVDFAVLMGKNPIASWKMMLNRKAKSTTYSVQKIENTAPIISQILFNGREKFMGDPYEPGEYEFVLEATDTKGNTATTRKTLYIIGSKEEIASKAISDDKNKTVTTVKAKNKKIIHTSNKEPKKIFYKIYFDKDTFNITKNSSETLDKFVEELKEFPNIKINIIGYSYSKEQKSKTKAYKRALVVKNILIKKYKIKSSRIIISTKIVDFKKTIVEITLK
ncbi:MAG: OmpA family protein [Elusimicrobiales bacterium]|nr:OmpA family protein [Elusimicrobiales bacterium]